MKLYVASSWRNPHIPDVVARLRAAGHEVYDFQNPSTGGYVGPYTAHLDGGFHWSDIDPAWETWDVATFRRHLTYDALAHAGYESDLGAMRWAEACVLVLPCGRSSHVEAGWFAGRGRPLYILIPDKVEPELTYKLAKSVNATVEELVSNLALDQVLGRPRQ